MTTIKSTDWTGFPVNEIYGTFTPDAYLASISSDKRETVDRSYMGYYAAWMNRNGNIIAVTSHSALGYDESWEHGYVRLAFERDALSIELPPAVTSRQIAAIAHLVKTHYKYRSFGAVARASLESDWGDCGVFETVNDLVSYLTEHKVSRVA